MILNLAGPAAVPGNLLAYLGHHLASDGLRFALRPEPFKEGWESYIYRFQLEPTAGLPSDFVRPLVLRVYSSMQGLPRLRHEFAAQKRMCELGYPVARPLLLEDSDSPFGGPFMIMEAVPGQTFVDFLLENPWKMVDGPGQMAAMHARLHRLPTAGFPAPEGPFLTRHFDEMRSIIRAFGLAGMMAGLDWLCVHRPEPPRQPSIVHLDFHPLNLLFEGRRFTALLDWTESDVGDRHADIAATIVLFKTAPLEYATFLDRLAALPGRWLLRRRYFRLYRRLLPLDRDTLAYYMAWAAFRRLCAYGRWLRAGPPSTGGKPSSMRYLSAEGVDRLRNYFHRWAGVGVSL